MREADLLSRAYVVDPVATEYRMIFHALRSIVAHAWGEEVLSPGARKLAEPLDYSLRVLAKCAVPPWLREYEKDIHRNRRVLDGRGLVVRTRAVDCQKWSCIEDLALRRSAESNYDQLPSLVILLVVLVALVLATLAFLALLLVVVDFPCVFGTKATWVFLLKSLESRDVLWESQYNIAILRYDVSVQLVQQLKCWLTVQEAPASI
jgi:hypothetical protein